MNPQTTQPQNSKAPVSLDQQAVNLAKSIRHVETSGTPDPFTAKGKSGEYGAYQYTAPTWQTLSQKHLGQAIPLDKATKEQQNEVAYKEIKSLKDQGYKPDQIASIWNSGKPDWQGNVGTNQYGVKYDTPDYVNKVTKTYQSFKQGQNPAQETTTSSVTQPTQNKGLLSNLAEGASNIFRDITKPAVTLAARPIQLAQTLAGQNPTENIPYYGDISTPKNFSDVGKDVGRGLETIALGLPGEGILGAAGMGALQGAGQAVEEGKSASEVATGAATGGLIGGAFGVAGKGFEKIAEYLPERISRAFIPGINEETNKYAVEKGLGSLGSMYKESESSLKTLGKNLDTVLNDPARQGVLATANDIFPAAQAAFPNAELNSEALIANLKKLVPLDTKLVDKLASEGLILKELNKLKSSIGSAAYKTVFDDPSVKAGKEVGNAIYQSIKDFVVKAAPEAAPIFDDFTKEIKLNGALSKAMRRGEKSKIFTLRDLVAMTSGFGVAGVPGAITGYAGERLISNPSVNLAAAGLLSKATNPAVQTAGNLAKRVTTKGLVKATGR